MGWRKRTDEYDFHTPQRLRFLVVHDIRKGKINESWKQVTWIAGPSGHPSTAADRPLELVAFPLSCWSLLVYSDPRDVHLGREFRARSWRTWPDPSNCEVKY